MRYRIFYEARIRQLIKQQENKDELMIKKVYYTKTAFRQDIQFEHVSLF